MLWQNPSHRGTEVTEGISVTGEAEVYGEIAVFFSAGSAPLCEPFSLIGQKECS